MSASTRARTDIFIYYFSILPMFPFFYSAIQQSVSFVKPAGAAAVSSVENPGVCDSPSSSVSTHTGHSPWPHTPLLCLKHSSMLQGLYTQGTALPHTWYTWSTAHLLYSTLILSTLFLNLFFFALLLPTLDYTILHYFFSALVWSVLTFFFANTPIYFAIC